MSATKNPPFDQSFDASYVAFSDDHAGGDLPTGCPPASFPRAGYRPVSYLVHGEQTDSQQSRVGAEIFNPARAGHAEIFNQLESGGRAGMAITEDPAASRRRLLREIRQLRSKAGLTQRDVAEQLDWSPSKVIRIEQGDVAISTTDLRALVQLYGTSDPKEIEEYTELARASKRQSSWNDYRDIFQRAAITYFQYESSASIIRQFEPLLVPGLLQTEEYTRALLKDAFDLSKDAIDRQVQARSARQEMLDRQNPPQMFFIMDEAATRRHIGSQNIMRRQLEHLVSLAEHPTVTIQIIPFSAGAHPGLSGPFTLLEFPSENDDTVLFLESRSDTVTRDDPEQIGRLLDTFWEMERKIATKPSELEAFFVSRNYFSSDGTYA